jgi:hypothetical protein
VAGARRAIPRRIHGVRRAINSTARSERRIAVRGPGVGVDTSCASADPAGGPWRSTARELPGARHAAQLNIAAVLKAGARADDQVTHGARDEDFPRAGLAEDPRRDVYGDPADVVVPQFALAGVDAGADLDTQCLDVGAQRLGAADGLRGAVERSEVAITGVLHHSAAESFGEVGGDLIEPVQHRPPPLVAGRRRVSRRRDHVGEQHGAQSPT